MDKKEFRKKMAKIRNSIDINYKKNADAKIFDLFVNDKLYLKSKNIFIFVSYNSEINTHNIIKRALKDQKNVYIPVINKEKNIMNISSLKDFDNLEKNYMGILEPKVEHISFANPNILDLSIVPGLAFDLNGYRMGYGGGFYDKFFASLSKDHVKLGLGYEKQLVDFVIHEDYDKKLDYFLCEKQIYKLGGI